MKLGLLLAIAKDRADVEEILGLNGFFDESQSVDIDELEPILKFRVPNEPSPPSEQTPTAAS